MDARETKEAIIIFLENVDDEGAEKLWKFIYENFEVVETNYDRKALEMARKEIQEGKFRFI